mmetsp:Transcript_35562/g.92714  ORF Transcript_35562/g.92714 Transcript_35562/m.92714 type:complete len:502 (-) Transcript_35562:823-2328(-)|eukprot:CAMPEP_0113893976 /NCGR_PEP_ID=MMETSP0780_2-20120614/16418_1 /TAXON_ID=652834 /ORGANISM="Palpitomonas bilix" /LENGTH=501 /DNA_ID=CAMNT_0000884379 /DNA_START=102 /DNA_END=1607 /DNA_ORIENTATION=- /assembly_acc=CAM_ASM_000599
MRNLGRVIGASTRLAYPNPVRGVSLVWAKRGPHAILTASARTFCAPAYKTGEETMDAEAFASNRSPGAAYFFQLWKEMTSEWDHAKENTTSIDDSEGGERRVKSMSDSEVQLYLPFASSPTLRAKYMNPFGEFRLGLLLEDLDAIAGVCAYKHCLPLKKPMTIVTAACDRMDLFSPLTLKKDLCISGNVIYTGKSSMEIFLQVQSVREKEGEVKEKEGADCSKAVAQPLPKLGSSVDLSNKELTPVFVASFTMVARDVATNKAAVVPLLVAEEGNEKRLCDLGKETKKKLMLDLKRIKEGGDTFFSLNELHTVQELHSEARRGGREDGVLYKQMSDSKAESIMLCHLQNRNIHGKIFGGYIMRKAFEMAHTQAYLYGNSRPIVQAVDKIRFRKPVEVGSILSLKTKVVYARGYPFTSAQVKVDAEVINPTTGNRDLTNDFFFTFSFPEGPVPRLMPESFDEMEDYVEGMRRQAQGREDVETRREMIMSASRMLLEKGKSKL